MRMLPWLGAVALFLYALSAAAQTIQPPPIAGGSVPPSALALTNTHVLVGNASNLGADVALSGDCTISNLGAITCGKTGGVSFGYFATGTDAANLTGTLAAGRLPARSVVQYFVNGSTGNDANDGLTPFTAKATIQSAEDAAATSGTVLVGPGTYTLAAAIATRPGVALVCADGAVITKASSTPAITALIDFNTNTANGASVQGCDINGNRAGNTDNTNVILVYIGAANDVSVTGNTIENSSGYLVDVGTGLRPNISNNLGRNFYGDGISVITGVAQEPTRALIRNNRFPSSIGQHAIAIVNSDFNQVSGNFITGSLLGVPGALLHVTTSGTDVQWVSGPDFSSLTAGQFLVINGGTEYLVAAKVSSTELTLGSSAGTLTNQLAAIGPGDLISIDSASFNTVADNICTYGVTHCIVVSNTTGSETAQKNLVLGNNTAYSGESCFSVEYTVNGTQTNDNTLQNNVLTDCGQDGAAGLAAATDGFYVSGAGINRVTLGGNFIRDDQGSPTMPYWLYASVASGQLVTIGNVVAGPTNGYTVEGGSTLGSAYSGNSGTLPCANGGTAGTASAWTDYTPALTVSSGTLTSAAGDGHWVQVCKTLFVSASVVITTNGTATGFLAFGLPNSLVSQSTFGQTMACRNDTTGVFLNGKLASSGTRVFIWGSGNAYPGADGVTLLCTGAIEVQ